MHGMQDVGFIGERETETERERDSDRERERETERETERERQRERDRETETERQRQRDRQRDRDRERDTRERDLSLLLIELLAVVMVFAQTHVQLRRLLSVPTAIRLLLPEHWRPHFILAAEGGDPRNCWGGAGRCRDSEGPLATPA